jgi:hypothetical protein
MGNFPMLPKRWSHFTLNGEIAHPLSQANIVLVDGERRAGKILVFVIVVFDFHSHLRSFHPPIFDGHCIHGASF